jgi:predicted anti-sigma-YlaC factor YlaD
MRAAAPAMAPPPRPAAAHSPPPASVGAGCPSCGTALSRGAVLCTACGYNLATGQRTVAGRPAALGKPAAPQYDAPWYKTVYPYLGFVVVVLGVLYFLGRGNPAMMLAFLGTAVLYSVTAHIIVVVAAFRESVGTGFLTLCIPFYALYFVFKVSDSDTLKLLYAVAVVINISLRFLK